MKSIKLSKKSKELGIQWLMGSAQTIKEARKLEKIFQKNVKTLKDKISNG